LSELMSDHQEIIIDVKYSNGYNSISIKLKDRVRYPYTFGKKVKIHKTGKLM